MTAPPFAHISPRDETAPSIAPDPPPISAPAPTFDRADVMAPLPDVIPPAPGPAFGYEAATVAEPIAAHTPTAQAPVTAAHEVPMPAAAPMTAPMAAPPVEAAPTRSAKADPDAWAHASWNAYAQPTPPSDSASLSWEGPAVDIPRPAPMPRDMELSRLLTTLPPPRRTAMPSWWRVGAMAAASALLAGFGALALLPSRSATPLASSLSDVQVELPAEPPAADEREAPIAAADDGALDEEVEEAGDPDEHEAPEEPETAAEAAPEKTVAKVAAPAPRAQAPSARWSPPRQPSRGGFLAAIAERKRTMGYIVARSSEPCVFFVDGTPHGAGKLLKVQAHPGAHRVSCRTEDGRQTQSVEVRSRRIAGTYFRL